MKNGRCSKQDARQRFEIKQYYLMCVTFVALSWLSLQSSLAKGCISEHLPTSLCQPHLHGHTWRWTHNRRSNQINTVAFLVSLLIVWQLKRSLVVGLVTSWASSDSDEKPPAPHCYWGESLGVLQDWISTQQPGSTSEYGHISTWNFLLILLQKSCLIEFSASNTNLDDISMCLHPFLLRKLHTFGNQK